MKAIFLNLIAASVALIAVPVFAGAQTTEISVNTYLMSSSLNFTKGQAVSLNFTNVDRVARSGRMYLVDAVGNTLKMDVFRAAPGQTVSLSFSFSDLPRMNPNTRVGARAVVVLTDPAGEATPPEPDLSLANVEIYDVASGKTTFGLLLPAVRNPHVFFPTDQ